MRTKEYEVYQLRLNCIKIIILILITILLLVNMINLISIKKITKEILEKDIDIQTDVNIEVNGIEGEDFQCYRNYGEENKKIEEKEEDDEEYYKDVYSFHDGSTIYVLPKNDRYRGFKSYMPYTSITNKDSLQYKLQDNYCMTNNLGFRLADGRYCVAVGSFAGLKIGQHFDLILENGITIPCIMADLKADDTTDEFNVYSINSNYCCSEFIVDYANLDHKIRVNGNASYAHEEWNSKVIAIRVFDSNIFDFI